MNTTYLLIGQDNLLIECATYLIQQHKHTIRYVISTTNAIQQWCSNNGIDCFVSFDELLSRNPTGVDYIFSIVNGYILKKNEISFARQGAINYHDALLPSYAGVNATTWALVNQEKVHGITWHYINESIDKGDVIHQESFPISDVDTALSLNLRCFEAGYNGFIKIINQIENNQLQSHKQSDIGRSYYSVSHVVPNLGFINWAEAYADKIIALHSALNFGHYDNNVGTLKLYMNDTYVIIHAIQKITQQFESVKSGTVLDFNERGCVISTQDYPLLIEKIATKEGRVVHGSGLHDEYGLEIGDQLPDISDFLTKENITHYKQALKNEEYWLQQLKLTKEHQALSTRIFSQSIAPSSIGHVSAANLKAHHNIRLLMTAAILLYLFRLNDYEEATVFFLPENNQNLSKLSTELFFSKLPFGYKSLIEMTGEAFIAAVSSELDVISKKNALLSDVCYRHRSLEYDNQSPSITIEYAKYHNKVPSKSLLHFIIDDDKKVMYLQHRIDVNHHGWILQPLLNNMSHHISTVLEYLATQPDKIIYSFSFLTEQELNEFMSLSVGKFIDLPSNTVASLFKSQVQYRPHQVAIITSDTTLSYQQLYEVIKNDYPSNIEFQPSKSCGLSDLIQSLALFLSNSHQYIVIDDQKYSEYEIINQTYQYAKQIFITQECILNVCTISDEIPKLVAMLTPLLVGGTLSFFQPETVKDTLNA